MIIAAFPLAMALIMEIWILLAGADTHIITGVLDLQNIVRRTAISALIAYALSFNLTCGRMDLSLGAQRLAGVIIGGNLGLSLGLSGIGLLLFALLFGILFGFVTGLLFVVTRVPAMVLGIGAGLIYEALAFITSEGKGFNLFGTEGNGILIDIWFTLGVIAVFIVLILYILGFTRYGYRLRAIQGSQRIAKASGINVFTNAILSYTFAGGAVAVSGMLDSAMSNGMKVATGFMSNGTVMANMFPMFLGMYLARRSNQAVGIMVASLTLTLFALGLSKLALNDAQQNVITMLLFLLLLVYLANEDIFRRKRAEKARLQEALRKKKSMLAMQA
ncbi:MAG: ABC transporter permease [Firmicutes bacterium]|nr:ABC transporter permease [Bacillota bacterium]